MGLENYNTPAKVIHQWEKGLLGRAECHFLVFQALTPVNLEDFLRHVTPDLLEELKVVAKNAPTTDEEWGQTFSIRTWCGPWNEEIAARVREEEKQAGRRYRVGIETLRAFLHQTE